MQVAYWGARRRSTQRGDAFKVPNMPRALEVDFLSSDSIRDATQSYTGLSHNPCDEPLQNKSEEGLFRVAPQHILMLRASVLHAPLLFIFHFTCFLTLHSNRARNSASGFFLGCNLPIPVY